MKQKLLIFVIPFLLLIHSSNTLAQGVWEEMNIPYSGNIKSITASPNGTIFAASTNDLFRSSDNGENWEHLQFPGDNIIIAVNQNGDVFVTDYHEIFRSLDNGNTWQVVNTGAPDGFSTIAINSDGVIAVGNINWEFGPLIYLSFDNGETWETKSAGGYTEQMKLAFNAQGELFMANSYNLVKSNDLGTTWSDPLISTGYLFNMAMAFDSNDEIYIAIDSEFGIYHSTDDGNTWQRVFNAGARAIAINSANHVYAGNSDLFMSSDHGVIWHTFPQLINASISSVCIDNSDNIYVATSKGVFRSFDNGLNWNLSYKGLYEPLVTDIESYNEDVYMTKNGRVFHSTDLGINWQQLDLPLINYYISSIKIKPNGEVYIFGQYSTFETFGVILKSSDNGQTWTELVSRKTSDIAFGNGNNLFIVSDSLIHRSSDNGINWQILNQNLPCLNPTKIAITNTGVIFVNSSICQDAIYVSTDNGDTWIEAGYGSMDPVIDLKVNAQGDVIILTNTSAIFSSTDNGSNWSQIPVDPQIEINTLDVDYQDNLLIGTNSGVYTSNNNGASWVQNSDGIETSDVTTLHVGIMGYAFIGTSNGKLYRQDYNVNTSDQLRDNLTIYPNPARNNFNVIYPWFQSGTVDHINIYNVYGNLVKAVTFDNANMKIDVSNLQAGIYMVSINDGPSKKLIIQ